MKDCMYPNAKWPEKVGKYPAVTKSGGGYFYDEVLEYRVWCHPEAGSPDLHNGDDYYNAFISYDEAIEFSGNTNGAESPIVLVLQREHINEPKKGVFEWKKEERITEWMVEWLENKRSDDSISTFLKGKMKRKKKFLGLF